MLRHCFVRGPIRIDPAGRCPNRARCSDRIVVMRVRLNVVVAIVAPCRCHRGLHRCRQRPRRATTPSKLSQVARGIRDARCPGNITATTSPSFDVDVTQSRGCHRRRALSEQEPRRLASLSCVCSRASSSHSSHLAVAAEGLTAPPPPRRNCTTSLAAYWKHATPATSSRQPPRPSRSTSIDPAVAIAAAH